MITFMTNPSSANHYDLLRGGARVKLTVGEILVREITPADIIDGKYMQLLQTDYAALLDWLCGKPEGWAKGLSRDDWTALREAEERVNFPFALAETKAAWERGQALKFVQAAIVEQSEALLRMIGSLGSSASTAASPAAVARKPLPSPSGGSGQ